jgi:hypothetical protein
VSGLTTPVPAGPISPAFFTFLDPFGQIASDLANPNATINDYLLAVEFAPQVAPVPEPSTWAMMILGFFGVGFMAYRRKQTTERPPSGGLFCWSGCRSRLSPDHLKKIRPRISPRPDLYGARFTSDRAAIVVSYRDDCRRCQTAALATLLQA